VTETPASVSGCAPLPATLPRPGRSRFVANTGT